MGIGNVLIHRHFSKTVLIIIPYHKELIVKGKKRYKYIWKIKSKKYLNFFKPCSSTRLMCLHAATVAFENVYNPSTKLLLKDVKQNKKCTYSREIQLAWEFNSETHITSFQVEGRSQRKLFVKFNSESP